MQKYKKKTQVEIPEGTNLNYLEAYLPIEEVLAGLLERIVQADFQELLEVEDLDSLKQKHYIVGIVDEVINTAQTQNWGLCMQNDFVYVYNGCFWKLTDKTRFKAFLGEAAQKMGYFRLESRYFEFRDKLFKQFITVGSLPAPKPPKDVTIINLRNGTLEITKQGARLRDFDRDDFLTYQLPFDYDPKADCSLFLTYLVRVLPNLEVQRVLCEYVGYVFTKHLKLEKCLLLYGSGANGKSVFFEVINALLGKENITNYSLGNLREEHNRAMIANKLLNYGSEIKGHLDSDEFKQLASGEPVQARLKYGNSFIMEDYAKLAFNCNELPREVEFTEAFFRRFLIIPFEVTIPVEERNPNLAKDIIAQELPGVLNWVIIGLEQLLSQDGFSRCSAISKVQERYKRESDSVSLCMDDKLLVPGPQFTKPLKQLYHEYRLYCIENGYSPVSNRRFADRLRKQNFIIERRNFGRVVYLSKGELGCHN